jgi:pilus assembly protein Flp/PilA
MEFLMSKFTSAVKAFAADENGVTAIEYGLIAALIGVAIVSVATQVGTKVTAVFTTIRDALPTTAPAAGGGGAAGG